MFSPEVASFPDLRPEIPGLGTRLGLKKMKLKGLECFLMLFFDYASAIIIAIKDWDELSSKSM